VNALPTGTVTLLFTDIEGSTKLVQALGDGYAGLLAEHCRIMRAAIADHGGTEVATEGDSFFAVFPTGSEALEATAAAQREVAAGNWPRGVNVRVRMGVHTGEGTLGGDNYIGLDVHRAARIAGAAHGGQIVVSETTRASVVDRLPAGTSLRDLGAHRLKDLAQPEHVYQLDVAGLPVEFPALRSLDARANNLPVQLTSFVGREAEVAAVQDLLDRARLVTLTGPGGAGKTRLGLQVAAERLLRHGDGAFFVELAPISAPDLLPSAIAAAVLIREATERPLLDTVTEALRDRDLLLVLDNFEHLQDAAPIVAGLLSAAPRLRVLVTSRARLNLRGEEEYPVPPLRIPDAGHLPTLAELSQFEGVSLFIERARSARPDFAVSAASAPAIAEIVSRLDGLPLAIELAAAKTRILTPEAILGRLGSRLAFLRGGARDLPARQQTLREAIDWSYQLLAAADQRSLRWLGVFMGGFTISAADDMFSGSGHEGDAVETLERLADQSLVRRLQGQHGEPRLSMLETIREFALERLAEAGELDEARRQHAEVVLATAEALEPQLASSADALDAMTNDHDNLRAALTWSIETGDADVGLRLGYAAWRFWQRRGHFHEARSWFDRILALPGAEVPSAARAKGLTGAAGIAYWQNDYTAALAWYNEAEDIVRGLGDRVWLADALYNTGETAAVAGDMATVAAKLAEGEAIGRELRDDAILSRFLQGAGYIAFMGDQLDDARGPLEEALAVALRGSDPAAIFAGHHTVGQVDRLQGRLDDAARHYREAIRLGFELGDIAQMTEPLQGLAAVLIATGEPKRGVRLLGANDAIRGRLGGGPPPEWLRLGDPLVDAKGTLGETAFAQAWDQGRCLSVDDAVAEAIGMGDVAVPTG
jgi:predicted ATPase/class 3 adenylate cyclase